MSNLRKVFRWGTLCALTLTAILLISCDMDDDNNVQPIPLSYVSIYNAIPDSPELDVTVDSRLVNPRALYITVPRSGYSSRPDIQIDS